MQTACINKEVIPSLDDKTLNELRKMKEIQTEIKRRKYLTVYRPYKLMTQEQYSYNQLLSLKDSYKIHGDIEKQLGEKTKIYGKTISRIDSILNDYFESKNINKIRVIDTSENYRIIMKIADFLKGFTSDERKQFIEKREQLNKPITFVDETSTGYMFQEYKFLFILLSGSLSGTKTKKELQNLKTDNWSIEKKTLWDTCIYSEIQTDQEAIMVDIEVNKQIYSVVEKFIKNKNRKDKLNLSGGVQKSIRELPFELQKVFKSNKAVFMENYANSEPNLLAICNLLYPGYTLKDIYKRIRSFTYNDRMRTAFEKIMVTYIRGQQNRGKDFIEFNDTIYNILFPTKHAGDTIRFRFIISLYNTILQNTAYPLRLYPEKRNGKDRFLTGYIGNW